jgi:hypothetical protein
MGFNIGSVLSSLNIPSLNLGSIGSDILTEGKKILGEVVKDSFTLSNQPGSGNTSASTMNLDVGGSNINLPNPIGALANKLLGGVDSELNKFGVNVDFKQVGKELFNLPTQSGGTVSVPSAASRAAAGSIPSTPQAAVASTHYAATTSGPMGLGGGGSGSTGSVTSSTSSSPSIGDYSGLGSNTSDILSAVGTAGSNLSSAMSALNSAVASGDQGAMEAASAKLQQANEMFSMISDILKDAHDTRMTMINNMAQ